MYAISSRLILTILNAGICILGDNLVEWNNESQLLKAVCDNLTHSLVGFVSALVMVSETNNQIVGIERVALIGVSVVVSSLIDVDHFVVAKSLKLSKAVSIDRRPFLHFTMIPLSMIVLMYLLHHVSHLPRLNLWLGFVACAFLSHHTRDATRRGFTLCPLGTTKPLPYWLYIAGVMTIPFVLVKWISITTSDTQFRHQPLEVMTV